MTIPHIISPEQLLDIYRQGCFPMADSVGDQAFYIVEPKERGLLPIKDLHIPKSLAKILKKHEFDVRFNESFEEVINACQEQTENRPDTWINDTIKDLFIELHKNGHAYSVEVWQDGTLTGGLYGLAIGSVFCGESMFSRTPNASKIALVYLCRILDETGFDLLDAQFMNDHLKQFGAYEMPQAEYLKLLREKCDEVTSLGEFTLLPMNQA